MWIDDDANALRSLPHHTTWKSVSPYSPTGLGLGIFSFGNPQGGRVPKRKVS